MNRAFTFSNSRIIQKLKNEFIPFAGNTAELQSSFSHDEFNASDWFMKMADQVKWRLQGDTTQGMYVAGADGTAYGWKNTPGISDTLRFLNKGLTDFNTKPPAKVEIAESEVAANFTHKPKPSTSIIAVYSRVCPIPEGADSRNRNIGRDYLWIEQEDVHAILTAAQTPDGVDRPELRLPKPIVARMCRFVFLDLIRGEPDFWESSDVKKAAFSLEQRGSTDGNVAFAFKGDFKNSVWAFMGGRGVEGTINGEFTVDAKAEKIVKFRAYAKCKAYGASEWTQRGLPHGTFPLVFAMTEATDDPRAHEIPPAAVSRKADYHDPKFPAFYK